MLWRRLGSGFELLMWVVVVVVVVKWGIGNRGRDCSCGCSLRLLIRQVRSGEKKKFNCRSEFVFCRHDGGYLWLNPEVAVMGQLSWFLSVRTVQIHYPISFSFF